MSRHPLPARSAAVLAATILASAAPAPADEPRWDAAAELSLARSGAVDETAAAGGLRLTFRPAGAFALDAAALVAPADLGEPAFSASQTELSLGLRVGPRPDPFGFYVAVRGGTLRFAGAPDPFACVAIFPPPLACILAQGRTSAQVQLAAGVERLLGEAWLVRLEVGDRVVRMPGPSFDASGEARQDDFWSHELRAAVAVGLRF
jgi:hypothetical protein